MKANFKWQKVFLSFLKTKRFSVWIQSHKELVAVIFFSVVIFTDLSGLDANIYKFLCSPFENITYKVTCPDYYDIPFWSFFEIIGVFLTAIIAVWIGLKSISQANKTAEIEQTPHVVAVDHLILAANNTKLHMIQFKNVGRGSAFNVFMTSDPDGNIPIADSSNPHTKNLAKDSNDRWAIDEHQVILGLNRQGKNIKHSIVKEIPREENAKELADSDFKLYFWYEDQLGARYKTTVTIRHSGYFFKVMRNEIEKVNDKL